MNAWDYIFIYVHIGLECEWKIPKAHDFNIDDWCLWWFFLVFQLEDKKVKDYREGCEHLYKVYKFIQK